MHKLFLDIYYYKESPRSKEIDFVVCNQDKAVELIQVAYDIEGEKLSSERRIRSSEPLLSCVVIS